MIFVLGQALGGAKPIPDELWKQERHRYLYKYGKAEDICEILIDDRDKK